MASMLQKLFRPTALTKAFHSSEMLYPASRMLFQTIPDSQQAVITKESFLGSSRPDNIFPSHYPGFYPSFSIGFHLNPILETRFVPSETEDVGLDDSRTVWADSVKKKRKKKMNKHKYRKLRKRLGRQS